jgi:cell division protein FtsL
MEEKNKFMKNFLIILTIIISSFTFTIYKVEQRVKGVMQEIKMVKTEIKKDSEEIRVLKAEYAYLSQPKRIEVIAKNYLKMDSLKDEDIRTIKGLPKRKSYYAEASVVEGVSN